ncbi:MAG: hypothetical protein ACRCX8_19745 [Sarcina sp.]
MIPICNLNKKQCCKKCDRYSICYKNCVFQPIMCSDCKYNKTKENEIMNNQEEIYFAGMNETVIIPSKEAENAGYDVYANFEEDFMVIPSHETVMIPTGLISACDSKYYFQLFERGSTGTKGIAQRCGE